MDIYSKLEFDDFLKVNEMLDNKPEMLTNPETRETGIELLQNAIRWNIEEVVHILYLSTVEESRIKLLRNYLLSMNTKCVELLARNRAKLTGPEWKGHSPAEIIFHRNNLEKRKEKLKLLIECGLDAGFCNDKGENLLHVFYHYFVKEEDKDVIEITQILLDAGVPFGELTKNHKQYSPLVYAIKSQNVELVSFLIKKGANVNEKFPGKYFPLFNAAKYKKVEIVDLLITNGADVLDKNNIDRTALHRACIYRHEKIIKLLMQKGADLKAVDEKGETPLAIMEPDVYYDNYDDYDYDAIEEMQIFNAVIQEIAKLKSFDESLVLQSDIELIQSTSKTKEYFEKCANELCLMASTKFYACHSYYCVLKMSKNIRRLANLTNNEEFVKSFEENLSFSYYKSDLQRIFDEAKAFRIKNQEVVNKLEFVFGDLFPDLVLRKLSKTLDTNDLPLE